jgi:hypothetical protein
MSVDATREGKTPAAVEDLVSFLYRDARRELGESTILDSNVEEVDRGTLRADDADVLNDKV